VFDAVLLGSLCAVFVVACTGLVLLFWHAQGHTAWRAKAGRLLVLAAGGLWVLAAVAVAARVLWRRLW
jgi:hypothetical protein